MPTPEEKKAAQREYDRAYYAAHSEEKRKYATEYRKAHREELNAKLRNWYNIKRDRPRTEHDKEIQRKWRKMNPGKVTVGNLRCRYNLTTEEAECLLVKRHEGVCAICGITRSKLLVVDHNHATGKVRGVLCKQCNLGLGHFEDNPDRLRKAADYIDDAG